jgi:hypothetical protein
VWLPLLLLGCALNTTRAGLLQVEGQKVLLVASEGGTLTVSTTGDNAPLRQLEGTRVSLTGRKVGRRLVPKDWKVTDAGDGSAPFVGRLRRYGSNWLIDDRNSGATILLDEASMGGLSAEEGHLVMVIGYVMGAQRVNVMLWKSLETPR